MCGICSILFGQNSKGGLIFTIILLSSDTDPGHKINPYLECVIETNPDATRHAVDLDQERKAGKVRSPIHGVPVLVKDVGVVDKPPFSVQPTKLLVRTWPPPTKCKRLLAHGRYLDV